MTQEQHNFDIEICGFPLAGKSCHLLDGSSIPTFVIDQQHMVVFWNRACESVSGYLTRDMVGTNRQWAPFYPVKRPTMADLILDNASPLEVSVHYADRWRQSLIIPDAYESEGFFPNMGNGGIWLFFTASPLFDMHGKRIGAIETLQNITLRKLAEEKLKDHQADLEERVRVRTEELALAHADIAAKNLILEETNEELSQYAFVVSHDLRAPLRAVRNYADFLREELEGTLSEDQLGYFDGMTSALKFGDELVSDLLDFSRISADGISLHPIQLGTFLTELIDDLNLPRDLKLICDSDLPSVFAENTLLRQIFVNLITNGFKFNKAADKRVEIGLAGSDERRCEVYVRDNGIGIDPQYHDRIFKMFKRLHTHKEFEGTGIGLPIVKKAAVKMMRSQKLFTTLDVKSGQI